MANDLAYNRVDRAGRLLLGTLEGQRVSVTEGPGGAWSRSRQVQYYEGPLASWGLLRRHLAEGELYPISALTDLAWAEFAAPEGRDLRYLQAVYLVRYLLDGGGEALAARFRGYLEALAAGSGIETLPLNQVLAVTWDQLEQGFRDWLSAGPPAR